MNIFVTDPCPFISARYLDDKRVIKMILESAQMLSTAIWECGGTGFYRPTHKNHPCSKWARETRSNYQWLVNHFRFLMEEYSRRYGKFHKCAEYLDSIISGLRYIPEGELTPFPNCTKFKDIPDVHRAYRECLLDKWQNDKRPPKWTNTNPPIWAKQLISAKQSKEVDNG